MVWLSRLDEFVCRGPTIKASRHRDARWLVLTLLLVLHWAAPHIDAPGLELPADEGGFGVSNYERSSLPAAMPEPSRCGTVNCCQKRTGRLPARRPAHYACCRHHAFQAAPGTIAENVSRLQLAFLINYYSRGPPGRLV
jgi:hypothetical protein